MVRLASLAHHFLEGRTILSKRARASESKEEKAVRFHELYSGLFKSEVKLKIIEFLLKHEASMSEREIASV